MKTDASGDSMWTTIVEENSVGYSVQQTSDSGYIVAGVNMDHGDLFLMKTNSMGDTVWTKNYGGAFGEICRSVQQTADNGFILVGETSSYGSGDDDIWLLKTNEDGDTLWTKTYGGTSWDYGHSVDQTFDGGYIVTGRTNSFCVGLSDIWLLRTDANGDTLWTKTFGGTGCEGGRFVQQTFDGGFMIVGYTDSFGAGDYDAWILKTNGNGDTLWTTLYGGPEFDRFYVGQQTSDAGYIFAGHTMSFGAAQNDVWFIKTEPDTLCIKERSITVSNQVYKSTTILAGPLLLPEGKTCRVFDITGRTVVSEKMKPGIYFVEVDGVITQKVVKIR
jgi:hypothetical protein